MPYSAVAGGGPVVACSQSAGACHAMNRRLTPLMTDPHRPTAPMSSVVEAPAAALLSNSGAWTLSGSTLLQR
jgi:hypothetical protein